MKVLKTCSSRLFIVYGGDDGEFEILIRPRYSNPLGYGSYKIADICCVCGVRAENVQQYVFCHGGDDGVLELLI